MREIPPQLLIALRKHIGTLGKYHGQDYELIEVLEHEPAVVLRDCNPTYVIQNDMHGEAHRIVSAAHTVPILSEVSATLHPVLADFFPRQIVSQLNALVE